MHEPAPSIFSLIAAGIYALVVLSAAAASLTALAKRQPARFWRGWAAIALLFAGLIAMRVLDLEAIWRDDMREWLRATHAYQSRRAIQGPIAAAILIVAAAAALLGGAKVLQSASGRRSFALRLGQAASLALMCLIALRLVSFSALDSLLFGPLKLNWIADLGATLFVGFAALFYVYAVRQATQADSRGVSRNDARR
ncbi:hypothetical protein [Erythrobacter sp. JK5]|uniref:hypothetical protein n=1 Tax=Erythrobacter sp. JK5 TaxID=2829500 RepID=UPI001BA9FEF1|nr:hypothetical protein [Erythrobacter sp. JK5]QUL37676.1 hypothetical protein KDC96_15225 [Erythrobacter sp. JK5]